MNIYNQQIKNKFKILEAALLLGVIISVFFTICGFKVKCEDISQKVLRLHVIANSNSAEDQELKLKVRDNILKYSENLMNSVDDKEHAENILTDNLSQIELVAKNTVYENGFTYPINAEIVNMYFTTRNYENVTLPAGNYDAIRITIGEAKGKNWWCVMFPPMCLPAAENSKELASVLNDDELSIVENSNKYEIRFKIVEILEKLK